MRPPPFSFGRLAVTQPSDLRNLGVQAVLNAPGQPLADRTRELMGSGFGHDFRDVRVHADGEAASAARSVGAAAFTVGGHIVFDRGFYSPESTAGRSLLAHELAHVLQQTGEGPPPGPQQELEARAASRAIQSGSRPRVESRSGVGIAAQPKATISDDDLDPDKALGITVVKMTDIEAKVRRVVDRPGPQAATGSADFSADPHRAKANLYHSHFRHDTERLSYAVGVFRAFLGSDGSPVDPVELERTVVAYEVSIEQQSADVLLHSPPTKAETRKLGELRTGRRQELAAREAERARQERERAKRLPEDISRYKCPDPGATESYVDEHIALPYDRLVPDPDPREGFDENEVSRVLHEPRRFEQLFRDAAHGLGKARWLVCAFESHVREDAEQVAHDLGDITTFEGLVHSLLGTGGYDFGRYGFSPNTQSGRHMFRIFSEEFAATAKDVQLSNTVISNLMNLWSGGKLAEATLASVESRIPTALPPPDPPAPPALEPWPSTGRSMSFPSSHPILGGTPANEQILESDVAEVTLAPTGTEGAGGTVMGKKPPKPPPKPPPAKPVSTAGGHEGKAAERPAPAPAARAVSGLPSADEDAVVKSYTRGLADMRERIDSLRRAEAATPRDQKKVDRARAALNSVNRQLDAIEQDATARKDGGELTRHLEPLKKERETMSTQGTIATEAGRRVQCDAVKQSPKNLRGMDFADIDKAMKAMKKVPEVDSASREAGKQATAHQRLTWKFDDGSRLVIDVPRELGGRPRSAELPHAELHGPMGERLDQQGIVVPEQSIAAHMTITDYTGVLEDYFAPARAGKK